MRAVLGSALVVAGAIALAGCGSSSDSTSARTFPAVEVSTRGWPTLPAHVNLASLGERPVEGTDGCKFTYETTAAFVTCDDEKDGTGEVKTHIPEKRPSCWKAFEYVCSASGGVEVRTKASTSGAAAELLHAIINQLTSANPMSSSAETAAWDFNSRLSGGYVLAGSFTLGAPHHIAQGIGRECPTNAATDTEIDGELKVSNATPKFPAQPGIIITLNVEPEATALFSLALGGECNSAPGTLTRTATESVETGGYFNEKYAVIVPGYYTPKSPGGDPRKLSGLALLASVFNQEGTGTGTEPVSASFTGPRGERTERIELAVAATLKREG